MYVICLVNRSLNKKKKKKKKEKKTNIEPGAYLRNIY